jgi:limonene-1,2-epoxide hydrolase
MLPSVPMETTTRSANAAASSNDIAVVEEFFAAFQAMDLDRALALMSDDVVYQNVPFPADRGKKAVTRTLKGFSRIMTSFDVGEDDAVLRGDVLHLAADPDRQIGERASELVDPRLGYAPRACEPAP